MQLIALLILFNILSTPIKPSRSIPISQDFQLDLIPSDVKLGTNSLYILFGESFLHPSIYEIDLTGKLIQEIVCPENQSILNYSFMKYHNMIVAVTRKDKHYRVLFWNKDGTFLGYGLDKSAKDPFNLYFRNIVEVSGQTFVTNWDYNERFDVYTSSITEKEISASPEGFMIVNKYIPFLTRHSPYKSIQSSFKQIHITRFGKDILTIKELNSEFQRHLPSKHGYIPNKITPISLSDRIPYDKVIKQDQLPQMNRYNKAFHSFTRITGFERYKNHLIISYTSPNPEYIYPSPESKTNTLSKTNGSKSPFILHVTAFTQNGHQSGMTIHTEGGYFLGTSDNSYLYILMETPSSKAIRSANYSILEYDINTLISDI